VNVAADADVFGLGRAVRALAAEAFGGRGFFCAVARADRRLVEVPYTFGEPQAARDLRLAALRALESTEGREGTEVSALSSADGIVPVPIGEPQGLDTVAFFAACRMACPQAHVIADIQLLGLKLGQLCLAFGADEVMGSIVDRREPRLGARVHSNELTRDEAAQLLRAADFRPCERTAHGEVCPP
jgi:2-iminoacetate synthase ThiH